MNNRFEMFNAMLERTKILVHGKVLTQNGQRREGGQVIPLRGIINGIMMEDGSGHNFIITIAQANGTVYTMFVKG